jgi:hypothetical protein
VAVLAIDARYCSVLPVGTSRIIRRFGPLALWGEARDQIAAGLTPDPIAPGSALSRLVLGVENSSLAVRWSTSREVEIGAAEQAYDTLDAVLREAASSKS